MSRTLYLTPLLGVGFLFAFCHFQDRETDQAERANRSSRSKSWDDSQGHGMANGESLRTKSKDRPNHPKPTIEETTELFRTTIIPVFDLPEDQTVVEGVELLNRLIQQTGVEPHRLRIVISAADPGRHLRCRSDLGVMRNVSLEYVVDCLFGGATRMRYRVAENGVIEVLGQTIPDDEPDPFAPPSDPE